MIRTLATIFALLCCAFGQANRTASVQLPKEARVLLKPVGRIEFAPIAESSGLVKSRRQDGVFWTHNDSGDSARIFAIRSDGSILEPEGRRAEPYRGIEIENAVNVDWEDIATDDKGNLLIAACGNNKNARRNLAIYIVPEPRPESTSKVRATHKIPFHYPDQKSFGDKPKNFDCEAVFWADGRVHLLTKHRSDAHTKLYRLDRTDPDTERSNPLTLLGEFDIRSMVTAADATPDGRRLAVLTYSDIWLFEVDDKSNDYFGGSVRWLPIAAGQCEGICFDGDDLLICNEQRDLFRVPVDRLHVVRSVQTP